MQPRSSRLARASLLFALLGFGSCFHGFSTARFEGDSARLAFLLFPVLAGVALLTGFVALVRLGQMPGRPGRGIAIAGSLLGAVGLVLTAVTYHLLSEL